MNSISGIQEKIQSLRDQMQNVLQNYSAQIQSYEEDLRKQIDLEYERQEQEKKIAAEEAQIASVSTMLRTLRKAMKNIPNENSESFFQEIDKFTMECFAISSSAVVPVSIPTPTPTLSSTPNKVTKSLSMVERAKVIGTLNINDFAIFREMTPDKQNRFLLSRYV